MFALILNTISSLSSKSWNCLNDGAKFWWQSFCRCSPKEHLVNVSFDSASLFLMYLRFWPEKRREYFLKCCIKKHFCYSTLISMRGFTQLISDIMWSNCFFEILKSIPPLWQVISSGLTVECYWNRRHHSQNTEYENHPWIKGMPVTAYETGLQNRSTLRAN